MQYVNWGYKFGVLQMEYECVMCCAHIHNRNRNSNDVFGAKSTCLLIRTEPDETNN